MSDGQNFSWVIASKNLRWKVRNKSTAIECPVSEKQVPFNYAQGRLSTPLKNAPLRACDFFDFLKNRRSKQTTYTAKNREISKKSQTLRMTGLLLI